jgi:hypothetical protein
MIVCEEWFSFSVLVLNESLNIKVETLCGWTLSRLGCKLTFLKQKCEQGEQGMSTIIDSIIDTFLD